MSDGFYCCAGQRISHKLSRLLHLSELAPGLERDKDPEILSQWAGEKVPAVHRGQTESCCYCVVALVAGRGPGGGRSSDAECFGEICDAYDRLLVTFIEGG